MLLYQAWLRCVVAIHDLNCCETYSLLQYAAAEEVELGLAESLNGDPSHDLPILAMLVSDVTTGISLNTNNTELVSTRFLASIPICIRLTHITPGCQRMLLSTAAIPARCGCGRCLMHCHYKDYSGDEG